MDVIKTVVVAVMFFLLGGACATPNDIGVLRFSAIGGWCFASALALAWKFFPK